MAEMSELKAYRLWPDEVRPGVNLGNDYYLKSEADKVIADLEESHKKEVEQLLIEIVEQKNKLQNVYSLLKETREWLIESQKLHKRCADNASKLIRHHKYKRCLEMAKWCHNQREIYERDSYNWKLEDAAVDSLRNKTNIMRKWRKRWLNIAEKFKHNSTAR